jgi:hypothetical protein
MIASGQALAMTKEKENIVLQADIDHIIITQN